MTKMFMLVCLLAGSVGFADDFMPREQVVMGCVSKQRGPDHGTDVRVVENVKSKQLFLLVGQTTIAGHKTVREKAVRKVVRSMPRPTLAWESKNYKLSTRTAGAHEWTYEGIFSQHKRGIPLYTLEMGCR